MERCRLHVMGASGSGTTTLARTLASYWSVPHADADDYFWVPTDPPYAERRPECDAVMLDSAAGPDELRDAVVAWAPRS